MSIKSPYKVVPFAFDKLISLLEDLSDTASSKHLSSNAHVKYLFDYLNALGAKTIVLESVYVDHDYLEDYAGYYVRCFNRYRRTTSRLHFFGLNFNSRQFRNIVLNFPSRRLSKSLTNGYLGFVVVKPLPQTIIGRTCLKTYDSDGGRRHFPTLHSYNLNLFGIPLNVKSLAYQEQDKVVAACATSALWSVFQGSGRIFHHVIPSPVEITKAASLHIPDSGLVPHEARTLHHSGLTSTQMAHGIRSIGMEPYLIGASTEFVTKSTAYAYLKAKIPALLGISLFDRTLPNVDPNFTGGKFLGKHAVVIAGYSLGQVATPYGGNGIILTASKIDKIYVHDDQIGPFAKMIFSANDWMQTAWADSQGTTGNVYAASDVLVIPLYHKIRIPYQVILDKIAEFDATIELFRTANFFPITARLEWDIYLTEVSEFKKEISSNLNIDKFMKLNGLLINMPKYLWRATGIDNGIAKFDVLFDATDIEQGAIINSILIYDATLRSIIVNLCPAILANVMFSNSIKMFFEKIIHPTSFKAIE